MPAYAGTTRAISARIASRRLAAERVGAVRVAPGARRRRRSRHSLRASPTRGPGDLGTERDAPLGRGRRAAALLLVARRGRAAARRSRPGRRASGASARCPGGRAAACAPSAARVTSGAGSTSRKLPPLDHSTSRSPRRAASTISAAVEPGRRRDRRSPTARRARRACSSVDRDAAGERGRVAAHLGAALHAGVAADRHEPGARRGRRCRARAPRLTIACTLSTPCACWVMPIDHTSTADFAVRVHAREPLHVGARSRPTRASSSVERLRPRARSSRPSKPSVCSVTNSRSMPPIASSCFSTPLTNATSPPVCTREELVGDLRAEHRALDVRRHPVALEAGLAQRVDDRDLRARASWRGTGTS